MCEPSTHHQSHQWNHARAPVPGKQCMRTGAWVRVNQCHCINTNAWPILNAGLLWYASSLCALLSWYLFRDAQQSQAGSPLPILSVWCHGIELVCVYLHWLPWTSQEGCPQLISSSSHCSMAAASGILEWVYVTNYSPGASVFRWTAQVSRVHSWYRAGSDKWLEHSY